MKQIMLRLATAVCTFVLGVAMAMFYLARQVPTVITPVVERIEAPLSTVAPSCYPGRSLKIQVVGRLLYFPPGVFSTNNWHDDFRRDWYSEHLRAMKESSFYFPDGSEQESYRFLWLRSFHHPIAVRVWSLAGKQLVTVKEMSGAGGYTPGKLIVNRTHTVTVCEWKEFTRLLEQTCYWNLPTDSDDRGGKDGAQWILEGVKGGRYHVVDRWSPEGGSYREACLYLLKLSGLGIDVSNESVY